MPSNRLTAINQNQNKCSYAVVINRETQYTYIYYENTNFYFECD